MNRGSSSAWGKKGFEAGRLAVDLYMILHASGNFLMAQFSNLKNRDFINVYNDFFLKVYSWNYQVFAKIMTEVLLGVLLSY